jgi:hypothetical protein
MRSPYLRQSWCWKIKFCYVWAFGSCFARLILDFFFTVVARRFFLATFVLSAASSTMVIQTLGSPAMPTKLFSCFSPQTLMLVLFYTCACSLSIAAQIIILREPSLAFIFLWLHSEIYKIVLWKKKEFKDFENLLVYFRLYFVLTRNTLYMSTSSWFFLVCIDQIRELPPHCVHLATRRPLVRWTDRTALGILGP